MSFSISHFSAEGRRAQSGFDHVCYRGQFVWDSITFGQWTLSMLADNSDLVCLSADFNTNLDLPVVPSSFIHRFHFRIVATATEAVFPKFHCQCFVFLKELLQALFYSLFKIVFILYEKENVRNRSLKVQENLSAIDVAV